jgi:hypothetical protein
MTKKWDAKAYCGCCLKRGRMSDRRYITLASIAAVRVKYGEEHGDDTKFDFSKYVDETAQLCNKCRNSLTSIYRLKKKEVERAQQEYEQCTSIVLYLIYRVENTRRIN